jgi:hypothetical protein
VVAGITGGLGAIDRGGLAEDVGDVFAGGVRLIASWPANCWLLLPCSEDVRAPWMQNGGGVRADTDPLPFNCRSDALPIARRFHEVPASP